MDSIKNNEDELLQGIIDKDGDCINASWCLVCPFADVCVSKAIQEARLLPRQSRVRLAYEKLFNKLLEIELEQDI